MASGGGFVRPVMRATPRRRDGSSVWLVGGAKIVLKVLSAIFFELFYEEGKGEKDGSRLKEVQKR